MATFRAFTTALLLTLTTSIFGATFTVTSSDAEGPGTLAQALLDANANPGLDQIRFAVTFAGISARGLPESTDPVDIDGLVNGTRVRISQPLMADGTAGFEFDTGSSGSSLRNVFVNEIVNTAVRIHGGVTGVTVENNIFRQRVLVSGNRNLIQDNVFQETALNGIVIFGGSNVLLRNRAPQLSISFGAEHNEVGRAGAGNTLGRMFDGGIGTRIIANTFTPMRSGSVTAIDVQPAGPEDTTIALNTIAGYTNGILVTNARGVTITANSISNTGIPIDLGGDGPTANDPAPDPDSGANNLQNFPVLTSATVSGGSLAITGTLASVPLTTFTIELFSNAAADPEARTFLGSFDVTTDAAGNAAFTRTVTATAAADEVITSTATNRATGDTSEVSAAVAVDAPGTLAFSTATYRINESDGTVTIAVDRTGGTEGTVSVQYATANGTATSPGDFAATSGTLTFGPGVATQSFTIPIVADAVGEPEESFIVTLSAPTGGATLGTPSTATIVIATHLAIPTASTWALILLALALAAITLVRIGG